MRKIVPCPPVNKYDTLKKASRLDKFIKLERVRRHLDRVQISVRETHGFFEAVYAEFRRRFDHLGTNKVKQRIVHRFIYKKIRLQLVRHQQKGEHDQRWWFSISISNPDKEIQFLLLDILYDIGIHTPERSYASVTEAEFALDLFPEDINDLYDLGIVLSKSIVLRHARAGSCRWIEGTLLQGHQGYVWKGAKGLRCYVKPGRPFYRIELQANKRLIKKHGIEVHDLPLDSSRIDIFDYLSRRCGLDEESLRRFVRLVCKKYGPSPDVVLSKMATAARARSMERMILENVVDDGVCDPLDLALQTAMPVGIQVDYFKKRKVELGFTSQVDEFFPKLNIKELIDDIRNGYVRRISA
jgi:hypothetical protein